MRREYDLLEIANGRVRWRAHVIGTLQARAKLQELSRTTHNECIVAKFPTREVVARIKLGSPLSRRPAVFEISYDYTQAIARVQLVRLHGCEVSFAIGNEAAKAILGRPQHWDLFTVGYAAPRETIRRMIEWLKAHYPGVPILEVGSPCAVGSFSANSSPNPDGSAPWIAAVAKALSVASPLPSPAASRPSQHSPTH